MLKFFFFFDEHEMLKFKNQIPHIDYKIVPSQKATERDSGLMP